MEQSKICRVEGNQTHNALNRRLGSILHYKLSMLKKDRLKASTLVKSQLREGGGKKIPS